MAEKGFHIDIFREKTIDEFTKILSEPNAKPDTGSAAAVVSALAASFLCRVSSLVQQGCENSERIDWLTRNSEILRGYFVKLVDEDVKCKGPLRRAEKEADRNKISAARQTAISICSEIISMNKKCLELAEELASFCDDNSACYLLECSELALASSKLCISYCLKMSSMSEDDTYRYVIRRENELNLQEMQENAERIRVMLQSGK